MSVELAVRSYGTGVSAMFHCIRWIHKIDPFKQSIAGFVIETLDTLSMLHETHRLKFIETFRKKAVVIVSVTALTALHGLSYYSPSNRLGQYVREHLPFIKFAAWVYFSQKSNHFYDLGAITYIMRQIKIVPPVVIKGFNVVAFLKSGAIAYYGNWFERIHTITFLFVNFYWVPKLLPKKS